MQVDFFNYALLLMSDILNWLMNLDAKKKLPTSATCRFHCDTNSIRIVSSSQTDYLFLSFIACITYSIHPLNFAWSKNSKKQILYACQTGGFGVGCPKNTCQFDMVRIFLKKYNNFLALSYVIKFHSIGVCYNDPRLYTIVTFFEWDRIIYFGRSLNRICYICKLLIKVSL